MPGWWRRLRDMPDRERARLVAAIGGGLVIGLLYALGLVALYLHLRYLRPLAPAAVTPAPATAVTSQPDPTATLFPTMTPRP